MKQTHSTTKLLAAAIFELIIAIDLLFPTWLGMDVYLASGSVPVARGKADEHAGKLCRQRF